MRSVNASIRQLTQTFTYADPIIFFCECDTPDCYGAIAMSGDAFDAWIADRAGWLLLDGHSSSRLRPPIEPASEQVLARPRPRRQPAALRRPIGKRWRRTGRQPARNSEPVEATTLP
jgi:hypothetical protein